MLFCGTSIFPIRISSMLKKLLIGVLVFVSCGVVGFAGMIGYVFYSAKPSYQVVAKDVEITTEWTDLTMTAPMKAEQDRQMIVLSGNGLDTRSFEAVLPDGTVVKPEIQIIDDQGSVYDTRLSTMNYRGPGFGPAKGLAFPKDRTYVKLRVRSDIPFKITKIYWVSSRLE